MCPSNATHADQRDAQRRRSSSGQGPGSVAGPRLPASLASTSAVLISMAATGTRRGKHKMLATRPRFKNPLLRVGVLALVLAQVFGASAQAAPADQQQVARKDILIIPTNVQVPAPDIWNPYIPGTYILQGMNQNLMEPLFMLNYETGAIDGWLASGYTANDAQTEFTVKLRPGTE